MKAIVISMMFVGVTLTIARFAIADDAPRSLSREPILQVAADVTCEDCGPGVAWMAGCPAGDDVLNNSGAEIGIYMPGDPTCSSPTPANFVLRGAVTVNRGASSGTQIDTEITAMELTGGGTTLVVGPGAGNAIKLQTLGTIIEQAGDNTLADSEFEVFFEAELAGFGKVWNHDALSISAVITCVPPNASYVRPADQCIPLYDDPNVGEGVVIAYLGQVRHDTVIPTVSEWGLIVLTLLGMAVGTIMIARKRRTTAA